MLLQVDKKLLNRYPRSSAMPKDTHTYSNSTVQWPEFPVEVSKVGHFQWPTAQQLLIENVLARGLGSEYPPSPPQTCSNPGIVMARPTCLHVHKSSRSKFLIWEKKNLLHMPTQNGHGIRRHDMCCAAMVGSIWPVIFYLLPGS